MHEEIDEDLVFHEYPTNVHDDNLEEEIIINHIVKEVLHCLICKEKGEDGGGGGGCK